MSDPRARACASSATPCRASSLCVHAHTVVLFPEPVQQMLHTISCYEQFIDNKSLLFCCSLSFSHFRPFHATFPNTGAKRWLMLMSLTVARFVIQILSGICFFCAFYLSLIFSPLNTLALLCPLCASAESGGNKYRKFGACPAP